MFLIRNISHEHADVFEVGCTNPQTQSKAVMATLTVSFDVLAASEALHRELA